jgi:uncharacterized protein YdhG (YjbR/CyaY superfamily)
MKNYLAKNVDEYISLYPKEIQVKLKKLREIIKSSAPYSLEVISYNMPAYKVFGRILLYFAVHSKHIGLYALPSAIIEFKNELKGYETSKGTIQFPLDKPIPYDLVKKIVKYRVKENLERKK